MQFVGDSVNKIEATRSEKLERPLKIEANVQLTDVKKRDIFAAGDKKDSVAVDYKFEVIYGEGSGKLLVEGAVFVVGDKKELDKILKAWKKKEGKLEGDLAIPFMNRAMELAYLAVIPVAKELKLPTPLRMPRFIKEKPKETKDYVG